MAERRTTETRTSKPLEAGGLSYPARAGREATTTGMPSCRRSAKASDGHVPLSPGSFYRHLAKLMDDGLVVELSQRRGGDDPRRGVYYRLTARGHSVLADERRRLAALVAAIDGLASRRGEDRRERHGYSAHDRRSDLRRPAAARIRPRFAIDSAPGCATHLPAIARPPDLPVLARATRASGSTHHRRHHPLRIRRSDPNHARRFRRRRRR